MMFIIKWKWCTGVIATLFTMQDDRTRIESLEINSYGKQQLDPIGGKVTNEVREIVGRLVREFDHNYSSVEDTDSGIIVERV